MLMKNTVTLAMIVKNEAANLEACLESVRGQVSEIVIVDTGSSDNTVEIARKYTDKVYHYPWHEDFSAARNYAIEKATGDWILSLDADEELLPGTGYLEQLSSGDNHLEAYLLPLNNHTSDTTGQYNTFLVLRLFKNDGRYRFKGRIHEQVTIPDSEAVGIAQGPVIGHKRPPAKERNRKRKRNLTLLKKAYTEDPDNDFLRYYLGVEWLALGKPDRALPFFRLAYENLTDNQILFRGPALRYLVMCLHAQGRLEEATALCLNAQERYPAFTDIYYLCGVLFAEKKEYRQAVKQLIKAVECGTPPVLYSHMSGTESFLAYYHLGHCHEMLGQVETARRYYEQALEINSDYIYPVYSLFLIVQAEHGLRRALDYLADKGYLNKTPLALAVADQFYRLGYPDLSRRCLEARETGRRTDEYSYYLGLYSIYSGKLRRGIKYLNRISEHSRFYPRAQVDKALALLLLGHYVQARLLVLELWKHRAARRDARVLLRLARYMQAQGTGGYHLKTPETVLLKPALDIYDRCSRYLPDGVDRKGTISIDVLIGSLESIILECTPEGYDALCKQLQDRAQNIRALMEYKFGPGGNRT